MLESVGVEPPDEEAYRVLLSAPGCTIAELAKHLDRDEREVATTVERLERLGLLTTTADHPVRLLPTRPDVAVDALVAVRRAELDRVRAEARVLLSEVRAQEQHRPENLVEVIVGQEAIAARFAQLLNGTRHQLLVLDRPPYASRPGETDPGSAVCSTRVWLSRASTLPIPSTFRAGWTRPTARPTPARPRGSIRRSR